MSTHAVQVSSPAPIVAKAAKTKKVKPVPVKKRPIGCNRKPSMQVEASLRSCAWACIESGYSYAEAKKLLSVYMISAALRCSEGVKTKAAARLKISRRHVDNYLARGKELL